jgi:hypothetical protein
MYKPNVPEVIAAKTSKTWDNTIQSAYPLKQLILIITVFMTC